MHTKLTNEQKNKTWYRMKLLKIFAAKNMLYWGKKDQLIHLIWKKIKLKAFKLRYLIKRTCESALLCIPGVQLTFSSLNHEVQYQLSRFHQYKWHLEVLTIEKGKQWGNFFQLLFFPRCHTVKRSRRMKNKQDAQNPGELWLLKMNFKSSIIYKE